MTSEEMQRKIEFIVEQQAQFVTNMQRLEQVQGKFESELQQLKEAALGTMSMIGTLGEFHKELTRSHKELAASHKELAESHNILAKAQAETNERLNAFIVVLEKHLTSNGAKGKRKKR